MTRDGVMRMSLKYLRLWLEHKANEHGVIEKFGISHLASEHGLSYNTARKMIDLLREDGFVVHVGINHDSHIIIKRSKTSLSDSQVSLSDTRVSLSGDPLEIKDSKTLRDHESLKISKNEKNNENVVADKPRQRTHISAEQKRKKRNAELSKVYADPFFRWLWERYPHNEATSGMDRTNCAGWFLEHIAKLENNEKHEQVANLGKYFARYRQWLDEVNGKPVAMHKALLHDQIPVGWDPKD